MDVREFIGKNVERHRKAAVMKDGARMTQIALADSLDVDRAYVSALERGFRNPTVVTLYRIAEALGVPFSALFEVPPGCKGPSGALKGPKTKKQQRELSASDDLKSNG